MKQRAGGRGAGDKEQKGEGADRRGSGIKSQYLLAFYRVENLPCFSSAARYGKIKPINFTVCLLPACSYTCSKAGLAFSWIHRAKVFIHNWGWSMSSVMTLASKGCAHKSRRLETAALETAESMHSSQGGLALSLGVQAGGLKILGLPRRESEFRSNLNSLAKLWLKTNCK